MNENEFPALSGIEFMIMDMLERDGEMFGLEMVERSGGALKRGTIYVTLGRMADKDLVTSWAEDGDEGGRGQKRLYSATDWGRRVLKAQQIALKYLNMGSW